MYLNATSAALEIGISYRTMRRRIEAGQIEAIKGSDGQYSIAVSEVERLKQLQLERPRPAMSSQKQTGHEQSDIEQRVADLEQRVRTLEAMVSQDRTVASHVPTESLQSQNKPVKITTDRLDTQPQQSPQNRNVDAKSGTPKTIADLPEGTITTMEFRARYDIKKKALDNYIAQGVYGQPLPLTKIPHPTRPGYNLTYFTPEQQEQAIALLRRHGKIK